MVILILRDPTRCWIPRKVEDQLLLHLRQGAWGQWAFAPLPVAATAGVGPITWAEREEIAEGIGHWIRRCLEGGHRGTSGRDRNPLQSRLWLVIRSIEGEDFNPPLAYRNWTSAKALVKRGAETGGSILWA